MNNLVFMTFLDCTKS